VTMLMIYRYDHSGHKPEAWTMLSLQNCNGSLTVWGSVLLVQQRMNIISCLIALHIVPSGTDSQSCFGAQPSGFNFHDPKYHRSIAQPNTTLA